MLLFIYPDELLKKEMDQINITVTDKIEKINTQVKDTQKTLTDKITIQEKALTDKINQQVIDSQKKLQDRITAQDKTVKEATEKIGNKHRYDLKYKQFL